MAGMIDRMIRAAKLDPQLYEEVEADRRLMGQALGVVALSSVAAGIGAWGKLSIGGVLGVVFMALLSWVIWAYATYLVGTKVLPEPQTRSDPGELLRTIGFSSAPGVIRVLGVIGGITWIVFAVASLWMVVAMVVAVRQALDYQSTARAAGVVIISWVIQALVAGLLSALFGGPQIHM